MFKKLTEILPEQLGSLKNDFTKNCRGILSNTFNKFDLVTREEFDAQAKVLARTREKLESLTEQLAKVEALLKDNPK